MALTEEDKKRIKEEEEYRKKVREEEEYRRQLHQDTQPTRHKKKTKRNWKKIIIFAVVIFAVLVVLGAVAGEPETDTTASQQANTTTTPTPTTTEIEVPCLTAKISHSSTQLHVENYSDYDWDADIILGVGGLFGDRYKYRTEVPIGQKVSIGLANFVDNKGNRFNPYQQAFNSVLISERSRLCDYEATVK